MEKEPILIENKDRFVMFPIKHKEIWDLYKKATQLFWIPDGADLSKDVEDWDKKLTDKERVTIQCVLVMFAFKYKINLPSILTKFIEEVQFPEARCFYGFQLMQVNIHAEFYSRVTGSLIPRTMDRLTEIYSRKGLFEGNKKWIQNYFFGDKSFAEKVVAYSAMQRIFHSSMFAILSGINSKRTMEVLAMISTFIFNDEGLLTDFSTSLYSQLKNKLSKGRVKEIILEATALEKEMFNSICSICDIKSGANAKITAYVDYITDRLLASFGCEPISNQKDESIFMKWDSNHVNIDPNFVWKESNEVFVFSLTEDF